MFVGPNKMGPKNWAVLVIMNMLGTELQCIILTERCWKGSPQHCPKKMSVHKAHISNQKKMLLDIIRSTHEYIHIAIQTSRKQQSWARVIFFPRNRVISGKVVLRDYQQEWVSLWSTADPSLVLVWEKGKLTQHCCPVSSDRIKNGITLSWWRGDAGKMAHAQLCRAV